MGATKKAHLSKEDRNASSFFIFNLWFFRPSNLNLTVLKISSNGFLQVTKVINPCLITRKRHYLYWKRWRFIWSSEQAPVLAQRTLIKFKERYFIQTVLTNPKCGSDVKKCIQNRATAPKRSNEILVSQTLEAVMFLHQLVVRK